MKKSSEEQILCYLTDDWQTRISNAPKNKGKEVKYRFAVTASKFFWGLTEYRNDSLSYIRVYGSNLTHLTPFFKTEAGLDAFESIRRCQQALEAIANIQPNLKPIPGGLEVDTAIDFAMQVDSAYRTNYALHDDIVKRFFGSTEETEEEAEEEVEEVTG